MKWIKIKVKENEMENKGTSKDVQDVNSWHLEEKPPYKKISFSYYYL